MAANSDRVCGKVKDAANTDKDRGQAAKILDIDFDAESIAGLMPGNDPSLCCVD